MEIWKSTTDTITIHLEMLESLKDNYIYVLHWKNQALVIDPGEENPVLEFLKKNELLLIGILNTHHHHDHTDGNCALKKKYDCSVIGPDDDRIPCLDQKVGDEELIIGPLGMQVMKAPGHTSTHVIYHIPQFYLLFTGDTLFGSGCGRLFEGTPKDLYDSLQRIMKLPDETLIFCGHEYTLKNLQFALSLEPQNEDIQKRLEKVNMLIQKHHPSIPFSLLEEKKTNPFLRLYSSAIKNALNMEGATEVEMFARLREMRNDF